jgi:hypothetical protein
LAIAGGGATKLMSTLLPEGTRIQYLNLVEIRSWFFRAFGSLLLKRLAVWYWKRAVIDRFESIYAQQRAPMST